MDPWKSRFLLETTIFRCYGSFRECTHGVYWGYNPLIRSPFTNLISWDIQVWRSERYKLEMQKWTKNILPTDVFFDGDESHGRIPKNLKRSPLKMISLDWPVFFQPPRNVKEFVGLVPPSAHRLMVLMDRMHIWIPAPSKRCQMVPERCQFTIP